MAEYRHYRDVLVIDLRRAQSDHCLERLRGLRDLGKLWRELASLGLVRPSCMSPLKFFTADELNSFFVSVSCASSACSAANLATALDFPLPSRPIFMYSNVSAEHVSQIILSTTSPSRAAGPDSVSLFSIHKAFARLAPLLALLFNACLRLDHFPPSWKRAFVRPLLKVNRPSSPSDTPPIANLCELSKVFERVVHRQIIEYINMNNIFDCRQSGFRGGYSTQSALLRVCHDVRHAVDMGRVTILVLFDFSKAFDTVSYSKLLIKLRGLGFSDVELTWVQSYLTDRTQAVVDEGGGCSSWLTTSLGVPEGSVLGPLLFTLLINNICSSLKYSQHMIFADDTQIYLSCLPSDLDHGIDFIAHDVGVIARFAAENGLKLNLTKSKAISLGSRAFVSRINLSILPRISTGGIALPFVSEARNLGVVMSSNLSWRSHILSISRKVHFSLHRLKYYKNILSRELRTIFAISLIFPILDYCCLVYNDLTKELNTKLQQLINCGIRFIFDLKRDVHISPFRRSLGWLTVRSRCLYFLGIATFNILNDNSPSNVCDLFVRPAPSVCPSRHLSTTGFAIPHFRTSTFRNSFYLSAIYFWHSLPDPVRSSPTIGILKGRLFEHLLGLDDDSNAPGSL